MTNDLIAMQRAVQRDWTPDSRWHIGDLAWQSPSLPGLGVAVWPDAWAWLTAPSGTR